MIKLSVNVNKVATLRNSRGGHTAVGARRHACLRGGGSARGDRASEGRRAAHHRARRARGVRRCCTSLGGRTEFNIEGDPRPDLLNLVHELRPTQCTIVPVQPGEITSQAGWPADTPHAAMAAVAADLRRSGIRVSLFVEPEEAPDPVGEGRGGRPGRALYRAVCAGLRARMRLRREARFAATPPRPSSRTSLGLGINAGHDLDLENLVLFRTLPHLEEVSIGHALISHALFVGLDRSVREYLSVLAVPDLFSSRH